MWQCSFFFLYYTPALGGADELFNDVNSFDKSLMGKIAMVEQLDKKEKTAFYVVLDAFLGKKK
jgi:hypothetical protein